MSEGSRHQRAATMPSRRGYLVGATWLIGLGVAFLVREAMGWSWAEAWPLFVILAGIATGVSTLAEGERGIGAAWAFTWPVAWFVVGVLLLGSTTRSLGVGPIELLAEWWPWALVLLGSWFLIGALVTGGQLVETLELPLGDAQQAQVEIKFGAGELVTRRATPGSLIEGTFRGGVRHRSISPGHVELRQDLDGGIPWLDRDVRWDVGLTDAVPLDLRLDVGAYRGTIDLSDLRLRTLQLHTGASETLVRLPRAAESTTVKGEIGAASLTLVVPAGVAARIRSRMALGTTRVDEGRFPRVGDVYQSVEYGTAPNQIEIDVQGGVGSVNVVSGP